ncbi:MAG: hypothetical protein COA47_11210 [Robiginitomaculum sp.]|nr:MAG: hypothetical protein COA47_11210 [Robiginitomaculum sp.]
MIRTSLISIVLVAAIAVTSCSKGRDMAPVVYRGPDADRTSPYEKAATPAALPEYRGEELPTDSAQVVSADTEALSEADEMDMLDHGPVEPGSQDDLAGDNETVEIVELAPQSVTSFPEQEIIPTRERPASIRVQSGDTLFSLSEKYQVALRPLIDLNGLKQPYDLNKGQVLNLPPPLHYRVRKGDTLYSISRRYKIDFQSLAGINGIDEPYMISPDSILVLPTLAGDQQGHWHAAAPKSAPAITPETGAAPKSGAKPTPAPKRKSIKPAATSTFIWPLEGKVLSRFGGKAGGMRNDGVNIAAKQDAEIRAAGAGTVIYSGSELKNYGRLILIRHGNGWVTAYAHNSQSNVREGAQVKSGEIIALAGSSGSVDVPQLHFETRKGVKPVDPLKHLPKR